MQVWPSAPVTPSAYGQRMGFQSYSDAEFQRVLKSWAGKTPAPGSVGEKALRDAQAELHRRMEGSDRER